MAICVFSESADSIGISDVTGRVQLLLGFVLGYEIIARTIFVDKCVLITVVGMLDAS